MSKELEKLKHKQYVAEHKLTAAKHMEKRLQSELKRLTRSERTHRLCTRAGMLETFLKEPTVLTDDDSIEIGDFVLVHAGKDNHEAVLEVVNIEYFDEENVPLPVEKTKRIIRKCTDEEFDPPDKLKRRKNGIYK